MSSALVTTRMGPYRLLRVLGRGGMGLVYEAVHEQLGRRVALKTLHSDLLEDDAHIRRFTREGRAACRVRHPHVVDVYELGSHDGVPYLVMDLCAGVHLAAHLAQRGPLPLSELADLMLPVIAAVSAAHAAGVVHRDLKPSNIMLASAAASPAHGDDRVTPKVLDFGTSRLLEGQETLTATGGLLGTLLYMAPEQARAPRDADALSDQYSLGVILYECATRERPFRGESAYELMQAIMTDPVRAPSLLRPDLPSAFDALVLRALSRRPYMRHASVAALGLALSAFASPAQRERWQEELSAAAARQPAPAQSLPTPVSLEVPTLSTASAPTVAARGARQKRSARLTARNALIVTALAGWALLPGTHAADMERQPPAPRAVVAPRAANRALEPSVAREHAPSSALAAPPTQERRAVLRQAKARRAARVRPDPRAVRVELGENGAPILE